MNQRYMSLCMVIRTPGSQSHLHPRCFKTMSTVVCFASHARMDSISPHAWCLTLSKAHAIRPEHVWYYSVVLHHTAPTSATKVTVLPVPLRPASQASPQKYALVVLGKFSGTLQSPNNPVGGTSSTSGTCVITLAVIDDDLSTTKNITSNRCEVWFDRGFY